MEHSGGGDAGGSEHRQGPVDHMQLEQHVFRYCIFIFF